MVPTKCTKRSWPSVVSRARSRNGARSCRCRRIHRKRWPRSPAYLRPWCAAPRGSMPGVATVRSITGLASPSTARAAPWCSASQTSRWPPATSVAKASASTAARQNNVQGSCDMGSFPHELTGYRHISDAVTRDLFGKTWASPSSPNPACAFPTCSSRARRQLQGALRAGRGRGAVRSEHAHVTAALSALECLVVQDIFLNETAEVRTCSSRLVVPREGRHLHQC